MIDKGSSVTVVGKTSTSYLFLGSNPGCTMSLIWDNQHGVQTIETDKVIFSREPREDSAQMADQILENYFNPKPPKKVNPVIENFDLWTYDYAAREATRLADAFNTQNMPKVDELLQKINGYIEKINAYREALANE